MFERYSDRARRLIFMALWSARNRGGSYIEPEDLLHALIRDLVHQDGAMRASMSGEVPLSVAIQVRPTDRAPALYGLLPDTRVHRLATPSNIARKSHIYRE